MSESPLQQETKHRSEGIEPYKGFISSTLKEGDLLPVGGEVFSEKLTLTLELDFKNLEGVSHLTKEKLEQKWPEVREKFSEWFKSTGIDMDPYTFFILYNTQIQVDKILATKDTRSEQVEGIRSERKSEYSKEDSKKISELVGLSACAERAALGAYMLQQFGMNARYIGGSYLSEPAFKEDGDPEQHSMVTVYSEPENKTYVFDVARPTDAGGVAIPKVSHFEGSLEQALSNADLQVPGSYIEATQTLARKLPDGQEYNPKEYIGFDDPLLSGVERKIINH